ncbi:hypothetical protein PVAP13_9KG390301 [Panicum virgatum]|uniref:Uncharacterized protein n=1 Tax=Panicum virgatum TaxID=38727 RepID=A0A8T0NXM8_PANVG|nr:hypothetical protein PVAP13_9KG390301 [Panicum virgatum]
MQPARTDPISNTRRQKQKCHPRRREELERAPPLRAVPSSACPAAGPPCLAALARAPQPRRCRTPAATAAPPPPRPPPATSASPARAPSRPVLRAPSRPGTGERRESAPVRRRMASAARRSGEAAEKGRRASGAEPWRARAAVRVVLRRPRRTLAAKGSGSLLPRHAGRAVAAPSSHLRPTPDEGRSLARRGAEVVGEELPRHAARQHDVRGRRGHRTRSRLQGGGPGSTRRPRIHPPLCSSVGLEREGGGGRTGRRRRNRRRPAMAFPASRWRSSRPADPSRCGRSSRPPLASGARAPGASAEREGGSGGDRGYGLDGAAARRGRRRPRLAWPRGLYAFEERGEVVCMRCWMPVRRCTVSSRRHICFCEWLLESILD